MRRTRKAHGPPCAFRGYVWHARRPRSAIGVISRSAHACLCPDLHKPLRGRRALVHLGDLSPSTARPARARAHVSVARWKDDTTRPRAGGSRACHTVCGPRRVAPRRLEPRPACVSFPCRVCVSRNPLACIAIRRGETRVRPPGAAPCVPVRACVPRPLWPGAPRVGPLGRHVHGCAACRVCVGDTAPAIYSFFYRVRAEARTPAHGRPRDTQRKPQRTAQVESVCTWSTVESAVSRVCTL